MRSLNVVTESVPLDAVQPHPRNPRDGDIGAIHESMQANGWYGTIIAQQSTGHILAGNHRWQAAQQAGMTEIPVTWVDVDDDQALRILLADNRANDRASYRDHELLDVLRDIREDTGTLAGTLYDDDDLNALIKQLEGGAVEFAEDESAALGGTYQVLVSCTNEREHAELLRRLSEEGYECRALIS